MSRMLTAGLALGFGLLGAATGASARDYGRTRPCCGPVGTTRHYRTIYPLQYVTRYHDQSVYHHVTRLHYVVNVTRIQPIIQYNDVTRLHHHTIVSVRDVPAYETQYLAPVPYVQQSPVYASGCGCGGE